MLTTLDISWNKFTQQQIESVFTALSKNHDLQYLNLAMTGVNEKTDLTDLRKFIRKSQYLLHLDLSGMLKTAEQVRRVVKSFAKNETLLSVHLSNTPEIRRVKLLQSYIRTKLKMNEFLPKRKKP